jgi:hypothetical protein
MGQFGFIANFGTRRINFHRAMSARQYRHSHSTDFIDLIKSTSMIPTAYRWSHANLRRSRRDDRNCRRTRNVGLRIYSRIFGKGPWPRGAGTIAKAIFVKGIAWQKTSYARSVSQRLKQSTSACLMVSGSAAKPMVNLRSQIARWQCTRTQKLRDGRPLLGAQRTGRRLLRKLGHGLPPTILDEGTVERVKV